MKIGGDRQMDAAAIIEAVERLSGSATISRREAGDGAAIVLPDGKKLLSLLELREEEEAWSLRHVRGTATLTRIESLIAHITRFRELAHGSEDDEYHYEPAAFASSTGITVVYDYHSAKGADRAEHRAQHAFPPSVAWSAWGRVFGRDLEQRALAEHLEDRIEDVLSPASPAVSEETLGLVKMLGLAIGEPVDLITAAREMRISVRREVVNAQSLGTGEVELHFSEEHTAQTRRNGTYTVPTGFLLGIPVHEDGPAYTMIVRLRYRLESSKVVWTLVPFRVDEIVRHAVEQQVERVREAFPEIPMLWGAPER